MNNIDYTSLLNKSSGLYSGLTVGDLVDAAHRFDGILREQLLRYPGLTVQDVAKALYQSEFGCGHFVTDRARGLRWLTEEEQSLASAPRTSEPPFVEPLGPSFCRVHLAHMKENGLSAETLFSLFALSAETPAGDMTRFRFLMDNLSSAISQNASLPFDREEAERFLSEYRAAGYPATHHSEAFRAAYAPAYRVIRSEYARFLPLFCAIDRLMKEKEQVVVAIEGGSASGKSTLGELLAKVYDCNLFHMDDFFLQMHQRTPERFSQPGGNVDYERFREEVLNPLLKGDSFSYRVFDCSQMALGESVHVHPIKLNIVEGAYSMHPHLSDAYDLSAFLKIDPNEQADRILKRNGPQMQKRFLTEWIPLELRYFESTRISERCTIVL